MIRDEPWLVRQVALLLVMLDELWPFLLVMLVLGLPVGLVWWALA